MFRVRTLARQRLIIRFSLAFEATNAAAGEGRGGARGPARGRLHRGPAARAGRFSGGVAKKKENLANNRVRGALRRVPGWLENRVTEGLQSSL